LILNHLDLHVPDVTAAREFFVQHFGFRHHATLGAEQVALDVVSHRVSSSVDEDVDHVFLGLQTRDGQQFDPPKKRRGRYLFYCLAPGNILVEVCAPSST
jgi:catechol 2,3-dioxygenase-like lactoylglutathione lyase family enzyme